LISAANEDAITSQAALALVLFESDEVTVAGGFYALLDGRQDGFSTGSSKDIGPLSMVMDLSLFSLALGITPTPACQVLALCTGCPVCGSNVGAGFTPALLNTSKTQGIDQFGFR
jgi:hypothetical protein